MVERGWVVVMVERGWVVVMVDRGCHTSFLHIVGVVAMATLVLSSWFAHKSLLFKLEARTGSGYPTNRRDTRRVGMRKDTNAVSVYVCMQSVCVLTSNFKVRQGHLCTCNNMHSHYNVWIIWFNFD